MNIFRRTRIFLASRSTLRFLKVFFFSLPVALGGVYFIFYSDMGINYFHRERIIQPLREEILFSPVKHNTNSAYTPDPIRDLREIRTYTKPAVLWEGTALEPSYELPKQGRPQTPRGEG